MSDIQPCASNRGIIDRPAPPQRPDSAPAPIGYVEDMRGVPTWEDLPEEIVRAAEDACGRRIDGTVGSFASPRTQHGGEYQQQLAWCVDHDAVTLVDARQRGLMLGNQFHAHGVWSAKVDRRLQTDPSVRVLHKQAAAPSPIAEGGDAAPRERGQTKRDPYSACYGGAHGEVWVNLPLRARQAVEFAAPFSAGLRSEHSRARLDWRPRFAKERVWFERRSATTLAGVYAFREHHNCSPHDLLSAQHALLPLPWDFVVLRVDLDPRTARGTLDGGTRRALEGR